MLTLFSALPLASDHRFLLASHQNVFSDKPGCEELALGCAGVSGRRVSLFGFFLACAWIALCWCLP